MKAYTEPKVESWAKWIRRFSVLLMIAALASLFFSFNLAILIAAAAIGVLAEIKINKINGLVTAIILAVYTGFESAHHFPAAVSQLVFLYGLCFFYLYNIYHVYSREIIGYSQSEVNPGDLLSFSDNPISWFIAEKENSTGVEGTLITIETQEDVLAVAAQVTIPADNDGILPVILLKGSTQSRLTKQIRAKIIQFSSATVVTGFILFGLGSMLSPTILGTIGLVISAALLGAMIFKIVIGPIYIARELIKKVEEITFL